MARIEKWLRRSAVRYRPAKIDRVRFLKAADKIRDLQHLVRQFKYALDLANQPNRAMRWEVERLRTALRGSYDPNETESHAMQRLREAEEAEEACYARRPN